eukprot:Em0590g2a
MDSLRLALVVLQKKHDNQQCADCGAEGQKPKCCIHVSSLNASLTVPGMDRPNAMLLTYRGESGKMRNIFVYADSGQIIMDWLCAIRMAKIIAANVVDIKDAVEITKDLTKWGELCKTPPQQTKLQKRFFVLDRNCLRYYKYPQDAEPLVVQKKPKKRCTPSLWGQLGCYRSGCSLACFLPGASPLPASSHTLYVPISGPLPALHAVQRHAQPVVGRRGLADPGGPPRSGRDQQPHPDVLSDFRLELIEADCGCDLTFKAVNSYIDAVFYSGKQAPPSSTVTTYLSLIKLNKWKNIVILYDISRSLFKATYVEFKRQLKTDPSLSDVQIAYESVITTPSFQSRPSSNPTPEPLRVQQRCHRPAQQRHVHVPAMLMMSAVHGNIFMQYHLNRTEQDHSSTAQNVLLISNKTYAHFLISTTTFNTAAPSGARTLPARFVSDLAYDQVDYDAVWSLALALNRSVPILKPAGHTPSVLRPGFNNTDAIDTILDQFYYDQPLSFAGASGQILFRNSTGDSATVIYIYQILNNSMTLISSATSGVLDTVDHRQCTRTTSTSSPPAPPSTTLPSPGCYLFIISCLLFTVPRTFEQGLLVQGVLCNTFVWSLVLGLAMVFGTVTAKIWRIYRIFVYFNNPGQLLSNYLLILLVIALAIVDTVILLHMDPHRSPPGLPDEASPFCTG